MLVIIGNWNTKVGNKAESNVIRKFGIAVINETDQLMDFSVVNNLSIANTHFNKQTSVYMDIIR